MKTIIISDIRGGSNSIIPYGLRLARAMESNVTVVHVIDPRVSQAQYSSFSDSQSLTPGEPMGFDETTNKEVTIINSELENYLSRETSRLNYPLKVETVVKNGSLTDEIELIIKEEPSCLVVTSSEPDKTIFETREEIYDFVKDSGALCVLVPPGYEFREYKRILHPVDFSSTELEKYSDLKFFFDAFDPVVNAVTVAAGEDYLELELKSNSWMNIAKDTLLPAKVNTNILKGEDNVETIAGYVMRNEHDLVMLFQHKKNLFRKNFKTAMVGEIIEKTNTPVLYFYRK